MSNRPEPFFIADDRALDFLNSICAPAGEDIEWIVDGADLVSWLEKAELISADEANFCLASFSQAELDEAAEKARGLRDRMRRFILSFAGEPLPPTALADLSEINTLLASDQTYRQLTLHEENASNANGIKISWQPKRRYRSADDLLLPIAEAIGDLATTADFDHVKNCEGPSCSLWFNDISKNHTRRWCTMSVCGNRAKAAAFRERKKRSN